MSAKSPEPPPKITLRFGQKASSDAVTTGVAVDNQALKRQQDLVKAGVNGQSSTTGAVSSTTSGLRNPFGGSHAGSGSTPVPTLNQIAQERRSSSAASPPSSSNGIKHETQPGQSPALAAVEPRRDSNASKEALPSPHLPASTMPPPASVTPRLPSGSPHPQTIASSNHVPHSHNLSNPLDSRWRLPGKGNAHTLLVQVRS